MHGRAITVWAILSVDGEGNDERNHRERPRRRAADERDELAAFSFDHLVGAQQEIPANVQAKGSCRLKIDNELEFDGLLNW